jgi:hypothetical protein
MFGQLTKRRGALTGAQRALSIKEMNRPIEIFTDDLKGKEAELADFRTKLALDEG